jgi:basic membrane protein A and related proteins
MITKRLWQWMSLFAILSVLLVACAAQPTTQAPATQAPPTEATTIEQPTIVAPTAAAKRDVQVCAMIAVGPDAGWDRTFYESFDRIVAEQPIEGVNVKPIKSTEGLWGDEAEAAMRTYAESGECDVIWAHGGLNENVDHLKKEFPKLMWIEVGSGVIDYGENNYHFWLRCHEASYAMGVLAGNLSESKVFGAVGTYPASDVNDSINSFFAGAASVKGDIVQKVAFTNSWYDPKAANEAAAAQIAAGATHIDMYAETFDTCAEKGAYCYGSYNDYSKDYPTTALASFVVKWDSSIKWVLNEWKTGIDGTGFHAPDSPTFTMSSDGSCDVKLSETLKSKLPAQALEAFEKTRQTILDGSLKVEFNDSTPVSDQ